MASRRASHNVPNSSGDQTPLLDGFKYDVDGITEGEILIAPVVDFLEGAEKAMKKEERAKNKRAVSDDDESSQGEKKMPKSRRGPNKPMETTNTTEQSVAMMDDFISTIDDAVREQRIDEKKAERLHECLQSGDWSEVAFSLLCEQIPLKRKGKGYSCRVCLVPKKGHSCLYCHVCSTPEKMFKKDDEHVCFNCLVCFEDGRKKKKLIQVNREGHVCPHGAPPPERYAEV